LINYISLSHAYWVTCYCKNRAVKRLHSGRNALIIVNLLLINRRDIMSDISVYFLVL